jgi:hypothetical protein
LSEQREQEYKKHVEFSQKPIVRNVQRVSPVLLVVDKDLSVELYKAIAFQKRASAVLAAMLVMLVSVYGVQVLRQQTFRQELVASAIDTSIGLRELFLASFQPHSSLPDYVIAKIQTPLEKYFSEKNNFTYSYVPVINSKKVSVVLPAQGKTFS